ncbi:hypothetical protein [Nafulsella turpanensis]|uniref:hypothetical protein n=1 Tax=Nafulsella turpanensis TaxID=1265690 RepID=UPI00135F170C|nr:hypothetical protein [Nafulsella turpanensis]
MNHSKNVKKGFGEMKEAAGTMVGGIMESMGGIGGQFAELTEAFPQMLGGIKGVTGGLKGFKLALAGTGIGLLVVALGSLVVYLTQTKEGTEIINTAFNTIGAVVTTLIKRIGYVGEAIWKVFSGDFEGAANAAKQALAGIGEELVNNYKNGKALGDAENKLARDKIKFLAKEKEMLAEVEKLKTEFEKEDVYSEKERLAFMNKALALEKKRAEEKKALAKEELRIQNQKNKMAGGEERITNAELQKTYELKAAVAEVEEETQGKMAELLTMQLEMNKSLREQDAARKQELADIREIQALRAKPLPDNVQSVGISADFGSVDVPDLAGTVDVKPMTQDFTELKAVLQETGTSFAGLQTFMTGLNMLPMSEQVGVLKSKLDELIPTFSSISEAMTASFQQFGDTLLNAAVQGGASLKDLAATAKEAAHGIIRSLIAQGVAALVKGALVNASFLGPVGLALAAPMAAAAGSLATAAFSSAIPAFANGGTMQEQGLAMVGERGPELVNLPQGANVTRANKTEQLLSQANNIHVTIESITRGEDLHHIVKEVQRRQGNNF